MVEWRNFSSLKCMYAGRFGGRKCFQLQLHKDEEKLGTDFLLFHLKYLTLWKHHGNKNVKGLKKLTHSAVMYLER